MARSLKNFEMGYAQTVVIYDWLKRVDLDAVPAEHKAVKQSLVDLFGWLEQSEISEVTDEEVARMQHEVSKDMGW